MTLSGLDADHDEGEDEPEDGHAATFARIEASS